MSKPIDDGVKRVMTDQYPTRTAEKIAAMVWAAHFIIIDTEKHHPDAAQWSTLAIRINRLVQMIVDGVREAIRAKKLTRNDANSILHIERIYRWYEEHRRWG